MGYFRKLKDSFDDEKHVALEMLMMTLILEFAALITLLVFGILTWK